MRCPGGAPDRHGLPEEFSRLKFSNTLVHITRYAGSFVLTTTAGLLVRGLLCSRRTGSAEHPQSGLLRFFDPRHGASAYLDPANAKLQPPFALRPLEFRLEAVTW